MKVLRLRTHYGIPALKGENAWTAGEAGTELRMVSGGAVVSKYGKHVWIPAQAMVSADVEPTAEHVPTKSPKVLGAELYAEKNGGTVLDALDKVDLDGLPKRPARAKKEPVAT
jgi:hypothetical protein